jgi:hypothetical protein
VSATVIFIYFIVVAVDVYSILNRMFVNLQSSSREMGHTADRHKFLCSVKNIRPQYISKLQCYILYIIKVQSTDSD